MSDVVERARVWLRDVHRGSAAEIIPDLLDELGRLRFDRLEQADEAHHWRGGAEKAAAERDELRAERDELLADPTDGELDAVARVICEGSRWGLVRDRGDYYPLAHAVIAAFLDERRESE